MTKLLSIALTASLLLGLAAQSSAQLSIDFRYEGWEDLLAKASAENKLIFLDAYASWCGPCKAMDRNVFTEPEVGSFYNANFVNAKIDMEVGEGPDLAQRYQVQVYPTFLFINGNGEIVHRAVGYQAPEDFLVLGATALDPLKSLASMDARFEKGDRDPEFLYNYTMARSEVYDNSHLPIASAYMATQSNWSTPTNMEFIINFCDDVKGDLYAYFVKHRSDFNSMFGEQVVSQRLSELVFEEIMLSTRIDKANLARELYREIDPKNGERMTAEFMVAYYIRLGDIEGYAEALVNYLDKFPSNDWEELNQAAWNFYEYIDNPQQLKKALGWAERSVKLNKNYYNMDTLAALHYKLGNKKPAKKAAEEAIKLARQSREDFRMTEDLLRLIEQMPNKRK